MQTHEFVDSGRGYTFHMKFIVKQHLTQDAHIFFIILHRTPNKGNDPHLVVFSLSVLQGQLDREDIKIWLKNCQCTTQNQLQHKLQVTHMSHSDARAEADLSFGLDSMQFGQDAASVWSQCGQDLAVTA